MNLTVIPLILFAVLLNATAQLSLKAGMGTFGHFDFSVGKLWLIGLQVFTTPAIVLGLACYVLSVGVWMLVLSRADVSVAYPMTSLAFVVNAIAAYYLLGEHISLLRLSGILIILAGVFIVARS